MSSQTEWPPNGHTPDLTITRGLLTLTVFLSLIISGKSYSVAIGYWLEIVLAATALIMFYKMELQEEEKSRSGSTGPYSYRI